MLARLTAPAVRARRPRAAGHASPARGWRLLLDWLEDQPGASWQERWLASGADRPGAGVAAGAGRGGCASRGQRSGWRHDAMSGALIVAICADLIRPVADLVHQRRYRARRAGPAHGPAPATRPGSRGWRRPASATRASAGRRAAGRLYRAAVILRRQGRQPGDITAGDRPGAAGPLRPARPRPRSAAARRVLPDAAPRWGSSSARPRPPCGSCAPPGSGRPAELIDRYQIWPAAPSATCWWITCRERQPALDYTSLESLAYYLGRSVLGRPGTPPSRHRQPAPARRRRPRLEAAAAHDQDSHRHRRRPDEKITTTAERVSYRECLTPVRAFYLDLAHWAIEDPARWGPVGRALPGRRRGESAGARPNAAARPGWTPAPASGCPSCPVLVRTVDRAAQRHRRRAGGRPRQARPARSSPPPGRP